MRTVRAVALASVAASAIAAVTPASAKSSAECAQEYSAKKAAGAAGAQTPDDYVKACLAAATAAQDAGHLDFLMEERNSMDGGTER